MEIPTYLKHVIRPTREIIGVCIKYALLLLKNVVF